ncbi:uncharacterized protein LOC141599727 [Silene latifolia]|uniref:uncharacterized protein LOC141599727 n=1 Tax=Silene latifolia TaxID=37657 RepID=UPI003D7749D8
MANQSQEISQAQQFYTSDSRAHLNREEKNDGKMSQMSNAASETAQKASNILQQTGESVKNIAAGATDAVKNSLGINNPSNTPSNTPGNTIATSNTTAIPTSATVHPTT